jgi:asparagine synthase (glutamine-hydrolysing)
VGVFLSGGLDSGAILAMSVPALPAPPRTFTVGFTSSEVRDETATAASAAAALGAPHTVVSLDPTTLGDLGPLVEALEEPIADSAVLPLWHLCRGTAREMKVALSGEGGDEALGGYTRYFWGWVANALSPAGAVAGRLAAALPPLPPRSHGALNLVRRAGKFAGTLALPEADRYLAWFRLFSPDERRALAGADGARVRDQVAELFQRGAAAGLDVVQRMQAVDLSVMLLDNLLVKADKLSMAHGLEVRVPLLDRELVELGLALPVRAKIGARGNKPYLRRLLEGRLPPAITRGGKRGFEIPVQRWFRDPGTAALRDRLTSGALVRGLGFSPAAIRAVIDRHLAGSDCGRQLFALTVLEHWSALHA